MSMHNFHVTLNKCVSKGKKNIKRPVNHYCFLFTGKLNYFGSKTWEKFSLPYFKHAAELAKVDNVKITFKFIVYDIDQMNVGTFSTALSGLGNMYPTIFNNIRSSKDVDGSDKFDFEKYKQIVKWFDDNNNIQCKLKKNKFESYCTRTFTFIDKLAFYYVDTKPLFEKVKNVFSNENLISFYAYGQHLQVMIASEQYPSIFSDCDKDTLIFKIRYDTCLTDVENYNTLQSFSDAFYCLYHDKYFTTTLPFPPDAFDFYNLPVVMYSSIQKNKSMYMNMHPDDILIIFNHEGIKKYVQCYTDWLLNKSSETFNPLNEPGKSIHFVGLNIHSSLGMFFLDNEFSTIDYTVEGYSLFGTILRQTTDKKNIEVTDINDDYKLRWYDNYNSIKNTIIEKFGKHDNT